MSMTASPKPHRGFRFPAEVIEHAVGLYHCFSLSLRDVETILAARSIVVSYESIRDWGLRFGRMFANELKRRRPRRRWRRNAVTPSPSQSQRNHPRQSLLEAFQARARAASPMLPASGR